MTSVPDVISRYYAAAAASDLDTLIGCFIIDAHVLDEGHDYHGVAEIRAWRQSLASQFTYTMEITGAKRPATGSTSSPPIWRVTSRAGLSTWTSASLWPTGSFQTFPFERVTPPVGARWLVSHPLTRRDRRDRRGTLPRPPGSDAARLVHFRVRPPSDCRVADSTPP